MATLNRAPRNRTLTLGEEEMQVYQATLFPWENARLGTQMPCAGKKVALWTNQIVHHNSLAVLEYLPDEFVDLLFLDPPYNLTKSFNGQVFRQRSPQDYAAWLNEWLPSLLRLLRKTASVYICGDWRSSGAIQQVIEQYLTIRNRITWERDKGRGANRNWKNCAEDIWFCTVSKYYTFDALAVRLKRRVIAPYVHRATRQPKDWQRSPQGNVRLTYASNLWTDLTIPFWSMPENTDHPTQKPEKMLAKILLASTQPGDFVFDPFLGSGTSAVVAKKLGRRYLGIEQDLQYCCLAAKRLALAENQRGIQGYTEGVFLDRNLG